jgi:hypothetical protein
MTVRQQEVENNNENPKSIQEHFIGSYLFYSSVPPMQRSKTKKKLWKFQQGVV